MGVPELCADHMGLARAIANEDYLSGPLPRHVYPDDVHSAAMFGLFQAAHSFDPTRGVPFTAWARRRIHGAIMDDLRHLTPTSRRTFEHVQAVADARDTLAVQLGRTPTNGEVADRLGRTVADLERWRVTARTTDVCHIEGFPNVAALDQATTGHWVGTPEDVVVARAEKRARAEDVRAAVARLHPRMRVVIDGRYLHPKPTRDMAAQLGVTESRVSQIHKLALSELRDTLVTA